MFKHKNLIIFIMTLVCFCMAGEPTHYIKGKWYKCETHYIEEPEFEKLPECSITNGACEDYDSKGNIIHIRKMDGEEIWRDFNTKGKVIHVKTSKGLEAWYEHDDKGNNIHWRSKSGLELWRHYDAKGDVYYEVDSDGDEYWYRWFYNKNINIKYQCSVDVDGNPVF